jgi:hypothetical protein
VSRAALVAPLIALAGCVVVDDDASLTIANRSSYTLVEVYLAADDDPSWGPNILPGVLYPGEDLIIEGIECDTYDVLVTDDTGVDCELGNLDICGGDEGWVVDDFTLDVCAFAP